MIGRRRIVAVVLAVGLVVAGCSGDAVLDEPSDSFCQGGSLYGLIRRVEAIVEVEEIVDSGRRVTRMEEQFSVFEARVVEVVYQEGWSVDPLASGGTVEFLDSRSPDHGEKGRVYLFLAAEDVTGLNGYSVRLAGVDDGEMLRLLGGWDRCAEGVAEFAGQVDWSLVEVHDGLPVASDELRLLAAWVLEIADTKQPRKNGPITRAWFGTVVVDAFGCQSVPIEELPERPPFKLRLDPDQVEAAGTASLEIDRMRPGDSASWGGSWECWTGTEWVATHQIEHGRTEADPGAALPIHPAAITTMPAIGYPIPDTFQITIPDVPPGWYRIREEISTKGETVVGYLAVEVVAAGEAGATSVYIEPPFTPINHVANALSALDSIRKNGGTVAWAEVTAVPAEGEFGTVRFEVVEVLWTEQEPPLSAGAFDDYSDPLLVVGGSILVAMDGETAYEIAIPDGEDGWTGTRPWTSALGLYAGEIIEQLASGPRTICPVDDEGVPEDWSLPEAVVAYIQQETPYQTARKIQRQQQRLVDRIDRFATSQPDMLDDVLGETVPVDYEAIRRAMIDGEEPVPSPSLTMFFHTGDLEERVTIMLVDIDNGLSLGWLEFSPGDTSAPGTGIPIVEAYVGMPVGDISIYLLANTISMTCFHPTDQIEATLLTGDLLVTIPNEDAAGATRVVMDLAAGTWETVTGDEIAGLFTE